MGPKLFWPVVFIMLALQLPGRACPFCSRTSTDLYTILSNSNTVCKAVRIGPSKYKLLSVLRGDAKVGRVVLAGEPLSELKADSVVLLATISNPSQPFWSEPARVLTPKEFAFFRSLLEAKSDKQRWDIAATNFLSTSKPVKDAAYNLLALAPLQEVQSRARLAGVKGLISIVLDGSVQEDHKALVYLMLIPHLNAQDKDWLKADLFKPRPKPQASYLPALMAAYAEVAGAAAVREMSQVYLTPQTSLSDAFSPVSGLKFIGTECKDANTRKAAREVIRKELASPQRNVFVIDVFREWKDYSVAPQVEKIAYDNADTPWVVGAVVGYFRSFKTPAAQQALQRLRKEFPTMVSER